jgi:hypothetical protein
MKTIVSALVLAKQCDHFLTILYVARSKRCCGANRWDVKSQERPLGPYTSL